jgi:hypothetical protein
MPIYYCIHVYRKARWGRQAGRRVYGRKQELDQRVIHRVIMMHIIFRVSWGCRMEGGERGD